MEQQKPSVGRIVHYWDNFPDGLNCFAALVTGVEDDDHVHLTVFRPHDFAQRLNVPRGAPGDLAARQPTWHWPERV